MGRGVDMAGGEEGAEDLPVKGEALTLDVGGAGPAAVGPLIPVEAPPAEVLEGPGGKGGTAAVGVEVLGAVEEGTLLLAGPLPGHAEGDGVPEVEGARGRGSKAATIGGGDRCTRLRRHFHP